MQHSDTCKHPFLLLNKTYLVFVLNNNLGVFIIGLLHSCLFGLLIVNFFLFWGGGNRDYTGRDLSMSAHSLRLGTEQLNYYN